VLRQAGIFNNACFFAQQAAEKAFKGFLVATGVDCPRSHPLDSLAALVPADERLSKLSPARLDRYYIAPRYPDALPPGGSILKSYGSPVDLLDSHTPDCTANNAGMVVGCRPSARVCSRTTGRQSIVYDLMTVKDWKRTYE